MYDSSVKLPFGVEYGELFQFGNFDQCMEIAGDFKDENVVVNPQYCLADVEIPDYRLRYGLTRHHIVSNNFFSLTASNQSNEAKLDNNFAK